MYAKHIEYNVCTPFYRFAQVSSAIFLLQTWPSELPHAAEVEKDPRPLPAVMEVGGWSPKREFWCTSKKLPLAGLVVENNYFGWTDLIKCVTASWKLVIILVVHHGASSLGSATSKSRAKITPLNTSLASAATEAKTKCRATMEGSSDMLSHSKKLHP